MTQACFDSVPHGEAHACEVVVVSRNRMPPATLLTSLLHVVQADTLTVSARGSADDRVLVHLALCVSALFLQVLDFPDLRRLVARRRDLTPTGPPPMSPRLAGLLFAVLSAGPAAAQQYATDRGVVLVAGTANVSHFHDRRSGGSSTTVSLNPRVGYFVIPGLALSANLQVASTSSDGASTHAWGVGPGATWYFRHRRVVLNPYLAVRTLYYRETTHLDGLPDLTTEQFSWAGAAGLSLFVARNAALLGELYYQHFHLAARVQGADVSASAEEYGVQFGVAVFVF